MDSLSRSEIRATRRSAERGDAVAQYNLGVWHLRDDPAGPDPERGRQWLEAAAAQGHAGAHCALGYLHLSAGKGREYDPAAARRRFAQAAAQGHPDAQFRLAEMCVTGFAGTPDAAKAREWFAKSARMGHTPAQCQLAYCLEHAIGGARDVVAATRWYQEAARLGEGRALVALGTRHALGHTLPRDPAAALACFLAAGDHPVAAAAAAGLERELDDDARRRARRRGPPRENQPPDPALIAARRVPAAHALSWRPRVSLVRGLLDEEERAHLIDAARGQIDPGRAGATAGAAALGGPVRDAVVWNVERRIAELVFLAPALGDAFRIVGRVEGWEAVPGDERAGGPGAPQTLLSLVIVLAADSPGGALLELGGETGPSRVEAGDALIVFHALPDGRPDPAARCVVLPAGGPLQWLAVKRIRAATRARDGDGLHRAA